MADYYALFLGNSLTLHGKCEYWWNENGMAATDSSHDYVSLVQKILTGRFRNVNVIRRNLSKWELHPELLSEILTEISRLITPEPDLVVIQLSENVRELSGFETNFRAFLLSFKAVCPHSTLIVADDFWSQEKSEIKRRVSTQIPGVRFADFTEVRANPENQCGLGALVFGDDGRPHRVEHEGVAAHPGDLGMARISEAIVSCLDRS